MNRNRRIATVTVAAGMAAVLTTGTVMAVQETGDQITKEETVYVNAGADGEVTDVTVSDWLKNSGTADGELADTSDLSDIKNVKGDETFQQDGENVTWNTDGDDIYYQGKSDKDLPVSVSIKYYLDGTEIKPEDLAGKTGHLRMEVTYTNTAKQTKKIDDKDVDIYSPFVMMTGMILPGDNYTNVTVDNGKVISDGDKEMVVGVAIPGLKESLDLSSDLSDKINIPESFTMEADVTNCPVKSTYTVALTDLLKNFDFSDNEDLDELKDNLNDLDDAALKLVDGTSDLFDGVDTLDEKYKEFADGISTLQDGVGELSEGATTLSDGISSYTSGADTLASVNNQLCENNDADFFVTVWCAVFEISTGKGIAANAGHEHPVLRRAGGLYELQVYKHSMPVGTFMDIPFRQHAFQLNPGDSFFVYTDGVAEATSGQKELYGTERMLAALNKEPDADPTQILENVTQDINRFVDGAEQFDDITMLSFLYLGPSGHLS